MNKAALAYENLEPANKVFEHIEAYVKAGQADEVKASRSLSLPRPLAGRG